MLSPARFPDLHEEDSILPPATRENPGQVMYHVSLRKKSFADLLFTRFIRKSTPLVSCFCNHRLPFFNFFTCHLATGNGPTGSRTEDGIFPNSNYGNPHHFQSELKRLGNALNDVIAMIEQEATNPGRTGDEDKLLMKFKGWRRELSAVRTGTGDRIGHRLDMGDGVPAELGGIFAD